MISATPTVPRGNVPVSVDRAGRDRSLDRYQLEALATNIMRGAARRRDVAAFITNLVRLVPFGTLPTIAITTAWHGFAPKILSRV